MLVFPGMVEVPEKRTSLNTVICEMLQKETYGDLLGRKCLHFLQLPDL